jgi:hypothetical protein
MAQINFQSLVHLYKRKVCLYHYFESIRFARLKLGVQLKVLVIWTQIDALLELAQELDYGTHLLLNLEPKPKP